MTLIKSISGIRGTIGGAVGDNLTPIDIVRFAAAYGEVLRRTYPNDKLKVVIGRDARISGEMVGNLVSSTLNGLGIDVTDLGLSTTPTVEIAVPDLNANGGIILTASHNPEQWNALKLLDNKGEFLSAEAGQEIIDLAESEDFHFADVNELGTTVSDNSFLQKHIDAVLNHPLVNREAIKKSNFKVALDSVNSTGGLFLPPLLKALGVNQVVELYSEPTGRFPHNPEPLPEHLTDLSEAVKEHGCHLGITVDPDVDRLAFVREDGLVFGEEYTLVAVADYVLSKQKGVAVSNLSSTRALRDVAEKNGGIHFASAVGEVNVVAMMKEKKAAIGGEGNGGVIVPDFHYGRDALIGIGLFLSHLAETGKSMSELRDSYPSYFISKNKIQLTPEIDVDDILDKVAEAYKNEAVNRIDGVKIDFEDGWVHLRKSNTEPIIRVYAEHKSEPEAIQLAEAIIGRVKAIIS
ncbi:MAG: phosphoglucosamine mutase [Flavobacteriales bacterium]|nr:phosphoglucosamine mutase [Flavobacteriales bacterium]